MQGFALATLETYVVQFVWVCFLLRGGLILCIKKKVECVDGCVIVTLSHVNETVVQRIKSTLRYAYGVAVHVRKVGRQFILRVAYRRGKECVFDTIERFAEVVRNVCEYTIHSPRLPATP